MRRIVVDISAHGFGHAGMTLPLLAALGTRGDIEIIIRSSLPLAWLAERLTVPFTHLAPSDPGEDFGMLMETAMRARPAATLERYIEMHHTINARIDSAAQALGRLAPDLLISNIPYIPLAAARSMGVPAIVFSTMNWADVFRHYCGHMPGAEPVLRQLSDAYNAADYFIQPTPYMPMPSILRGRPVGPVARLGQDRRAELRRRLGMGEAGRVILVGLGGLPMPVAYEQWPSFGDHRLLLGSDDHTGRADILPYEALGFSFLDLMRSSDVVVLKSGYGTVAEAICGGTPTVHVIREGWPETKALTGWMAAHGHTISITETRFRCGLFMEEALAARARPLPPPPLPTGIKEAAVMICCALGIDPARPVES